MASNKVILWVTIALSAVAAALAVVAAVLAGTFLSTAHLHPATLPIGAVALALGVLGGVGWILTLLGYRRQR